MYNYSSYPSLLLFRGNSEPTNRCPYDEDCPPVKEGCPHPGDRKGLDCWEFYSGGREQEDITFWMSTISKGLNPYDEEAKLKAEKKRRADEDKRIRAETKERNDRDKRLKLENEKRKTAEAKAAMAADLQRPEAVYALTLAGASVLDTDFAGNPPFLSTAPVFIREAAVPPPSFVACSYM